MNSRVLAHSLMGMLGLAACAAVLPACDDNPDTPAEAIERAGDNIEDAADDAGDATDDAADDVEDAVDDAVD